jgi:hypothetical protein
MSALGRKRTFRGAIATLLYPRKRTFGSAVSMSAKGQKQIFNLSAPFISDRLRAKSGIETFAHTSRQIPRGNCHAISWRLLPIRSDHGKCSIRLEQAIKLILTRKPRSYEDELAHLSALSPKTETQSARPHVRFWVMCGSASARTLPSKADMDRQFWNARQGHKRTFWPSIDGVRFTPESGHSEAFRKCPLRAKSRHHTANRVRSVRESCTVACPV